MKLLAEPNCELRYSRISRSAGDTAESDRTKTSVWLRERWCVGNVEEFRTELQVHNFG
jgi:hypothetical protein